MSDIFDQAMFRRPLAEADPDVAAAIAHEEHRQESGLELIASENFVSVAVLEAAGSVLTNKYAEGYPGKRYYGGCEHVDVVEALAIERSKTAPTAPPQTMPETTRRRPKRRASENTRAATEIQRS